MNDIKEILILGAGVSGLSCGILLLKKGYKVVIWAKDLPPNITSNTAAAYWFPYLSKPEDKVAKWARFTLDYAKKELINDPKSGCRILQGMELFDHKVKILLGEIQQIALEEPDQKNYLMAM